MQKLSQCFILKLAQGDVSRNKHFSQLAVKFMLLAYTRKNTSWEVGVTDVNVEDPVAASLFVVKREMGFSLQMLFDLASSFNNHIFVTNFTTGDFISDVCWGFPFVISLCCGLR